ncbi:MAG: glycosyltransferase family 2 protein [Candidatus Levybacteria bacterium]|nr:glycosyltransferase family 2 protein [Candidatus Levybacteria bacterium]
MVDLSIIILSYNTKDLTIQCVKSVVKQYQKELERKEIEIIVVDNNSVDDSVLAISSLFLKNFSVKLILNKENLGFAKGCNIGAKAAKGKYILFLNSDTQVEDEGFIQMAVFLDKNPKIAILGGKLRNSDGSIQRSAGKFYNLLSLIIMLFGLERFGFLRSSPNKIQKVDWVSGACMMVRSDIFKKLSGFDESLFMYVEDMEICFRAKKLDFLTYFYPNISLRHKSLGSSNRTFAIINVYKGILHFYSKHKNRLEYLIAKTLLIAKAEILILIGFLTSNSDLKNRYKKAINFDL